MQLDIRQGASEFAATIMVLSKGTLAGLLGALAT